jgi:hypothetical protein
MDQLLATDGHKVSSVLPTHLVFKSGVPVWKWQVVQTEPSKIMFHYLLRNDQSLSDEMKSTLVLTMKKYLGESMQVQFVEGDFETTRSGKHRFVINKVSESINIGTSLV